MISPLPPGPPSVVFVFQDPEIYSKLAEAFAPNIFGLEDTKKGILLQLFGGANKSFQESGRGRFRGDINILMCGDPGVSKSQLLQYAVNLASRGIYTSGLFAGTRRQKRK